MLKIRTSVTIAAATATIFSVCNADEFLSLSAGTPGSGTYQTRSGCIAHSPPVMPKGEQMHGRSALRILEAIYAQQNLSRLRAGNNKCTCEIRFPTWHAALAEYDLNFRDQAKKYSRDWIGDFTTKALNSANVELSRACRSQGIF